MDDTCRKCYHTDPTDNHYGLCNECGEEQDLDAATGCDHFTQTKPEASEHAINTEMVETWAELYGTYEKAKEARQDPIHQRLQSKVLNLTIRARVAERKVKYITAYDDTDCDKCQLDYTECNYEKCKYEPTTLRQQVGSLSALLAGKEERIRRLKEAQEDTKEIKLFVICHFWRCVVANVYIFTDEAKADQKHKEIREDPDNSLPTDPDDDSEYYDCITYQEIQITIPQPTYNDTTCDDCKLDSADCNYDYCEDEPTTLRQKASNLAAQLADEEERLRRLKEALTISGLYETVKDIFEDEIVI